VAAGRITQQKDYATLLRMLVRLLPKHPDTRLAIAGTGRKRDTRTLQSAIHKAGLSHAVELLGWVPEVYDLIAAADAFVQSSIDESFGQTLIEAVGLGVPLATTTVGSVGEVLGDFHGFIASGDDAALADRVELLLGDQQAARTSAWSVARAIRRKYSAQHMAADYLAEFLRTARPEGTTT
jgi:glycosyltransferase involved in cell wall biosynthesis